MQDPQSTSDNETPVLYGPEYWAHFLDDLDDDDYSGERPHLISVDELRAAGALDVPAAWRKSLGGEEPRFFSRDLTTMMNQNRQPRFKTILITTNPRPYLMTTINEHRR